MGFFDGAVRGLIGFLVVIFGLVIGSNLVSGSYVDIFLIGSLTLWLQQALGWLVIALSVIAGIGFIIYAVAIDN